MKIWIRLVLCAAALAFPAVAEPAPVPLDDAGFTQYVRHKIQSHTIRPARVMGAFEVGLRITNGFSVPLGFSSVHIVCRRDPGGCDAAIDTYINVTMAGVIASANQGPGFSVVPLLAGRDAFMAYVVQRLQFPGHVVRADAHGFRLTVTRGDGQPIPLDFTGAYRRCVTAVDFDCHPAVDSLLERLNGALARAEPRDFRIRLTATADCRQNGGAIGACTLAPSRDPLAPVVRRRFANIDEFCLKAEAYDSTLLVNADAHDLGLGTDGALDRCEQATRTALSGFSAQRPRGPPPESGVASFAGSYAAAHVLFAADWAGLAAKSGGHLLMSVPSMNLVFFTTDTRDEVLAKLKEETAEVYDEAAVGDRISPDIYRWTGSGFELATPPGIDPGPTSVMDSAVRRRPSSSPRHIEI